MECMFEECKMLYKEGISMCGELAARAEKDGETVYAVRVRTVFLGVSSHIQSTTTKKAAGVGEAERLLLHSPSDACTVCGFTLALARCS
jgi:hypothetical protein